MSKEAYHTSLERRLSDLNIQIEKARTRLEGGDLRDHVEAAGDLRVLEDQRDEVQRRLTALKKEPEGGWENTKTGVEEAFRDAFGVVERWIQKYGGMQ